MPEKNKRFAITFDGGQQAAAVLVAKNADPAMIVGQLALETGHPAIFITGGASNMSEEDKQMTRLIIEEGVVRFAHENGVTLIDGGTESGVMKMIGEARRKLGYDFPLIGVAPLGRVQYPGYANPEHEAALEDSHSHFVLVDVPDWGDESEMIVHLARAIAGGEQPTTGILINGGRISKKDVFLATTRSDDKMPILVLEGSGRFADELATAFRTGKTSQSIIRAIIAGGDIELVSTAEGPDAMRQKLEARFKKA